MTACVITRPRSEDEQLLGNLQRNQFGIKKQPYRDRSSTGRRTPAIAARDELVRTASCPGETHTVNQITLEGNWNAGSE